MPERDDTVRRSYFRNRITFLGAMLVVAALLLGTTIFLQEMVASRTTPYTGILYVVASAILVTGFALVPIGMLWERSRILRGRQRKVPLSVFRFDVANPEQRLAALSLLGGLVVVVILVSVGSYKSFHATESVEFCGQLCHTVMDPEWVRYNASPHARVACAECHIGEGADWFVKSKISGLRQVWAVTVDSYSRPIPTPIHDLRPARETCEQCHWRRKFTGYKEVVESYYLADEDNTRRQLRMLVKIGGEKSARGKGSGIHYHMLIAKKVEYVAIDERRQKIAWLRVARDDGSVSEYENENYPLSDVERAQLETRTMDCMDCHNRPAHRFPTAMRSVNEALEEGTIDDELPLIKLQAVNAIDTEYESSEEANAGIEAELLDFYREEYPEVFEHRNAALRGSIRTIQGIYAETVFPEMKASWLAYPDNIGHRDSPGCFRCHNDAMVSRSGDEMVTDCNSCHIILAQGDDIQAVDVHLDEGLPFVHPEDGSEIDEFTDCVDCHTGGAGTYE